jgi:phenylacetate-coenzyme A ligase PaaK-like adenylate-forming protein
LKFLSVSRDPGDLYLGRFYVIHTSGSSGEVGCYPYSREEWTAGIAHGLRMHPFAPRVQRIAFFGATRGHFAGVSMVATGQRSINRLFYRIRWFEINSPLAVVVRGLNEFQPHVLVGYATALKILADSLEAGALQIRPRTVESSGEPLNRADRARLHSVFGVPPLNVYSCTEHMLMGMGTSAESGMLLFEDDLIFELQPDHTCITNLFNRTLPLIRYRMEDVLTPVADVRSALPYRTVKEIVGRNEHVPYLRNVHGDEDFISPHIINEFFVPGLRRFQMQLHDHASFLFKVCLESGLDAAARSAVLHKINVRWREILAEKQMQNVAFEVKAVPALDVDAKTGKFRLVLRAAA